MKKPKPPVKKPTHRRSKGTQHPLHAETLDHMAGELAMTSTNPDACISRRQLIDLLQAEAKRIRTILR